jgi:hypothetical protein
LKKKIDSNDKKIDILLNIFKMKEINYSKLNVLNELYDKGSIPKNKFDNLLVRNTKLDINNYGMGGTLSKERRFNKPLNNLYLSLKIMQEKEKLSNKSSNNTPKQNNSPMSSTNNTVLNSYFSDKLNKSKGVKM